MRQSIRVLGKNLLNSILIWLLIVFPAGLWAVLYFNDDIWWLENITGYPALFAGLYLGLVVRFLFGQRWRMALTCATLAMTFLMLTPPNERTLVVRCDNSISVLQYNMFYANPYTNELLTYLISQSADLVILQEVTPQVGERLQSLNDRYPYIYGGQEGVGYPSSQMILSRYPLNGTSVLITPDGQSIIRTNWQVGLQKIIVFAAHPPSPRTKASWYRRNVLIETIESLIRLYPSDDVLVVGDFNLSSRSVRFTQSFLDFQTVPVASWPNWAQGMTTPSSSMIAIDHLWLKSTNEARKICHRSSQSVLRGSDHKMVLTTIGY